MSTKKQKLELTWIGKEKRPRLEPRILLEAKALSYRAELEGKPAFPVRRFSGNTAIPPKTTIST